MAARLLAVAICMLAWPALAQAHSEDLAVLDGTPHVASVSNAGLLTVDGQVLNHDHSRPAGQPDIVARGGRLWVTWTEQDPSGIWQVRVAKERGDGVIRELVRGPRPITLPGSLGSANPRIAVQARTPYVSYTEYMPDNPRVEVVRLRVYPTPKTGFDHITPPGLNVHEPYAGGRITVSFGRIYLAVGFEDELSLWRLQASDWTHLASLDYGISAGDLVDGGSDRLFLAWDQRVHVIDRDGTITMLPQDPGVGWGWGALAVVRGVRYAAGVESARPGDSGELRVAVFRKSGWRQLAVPAEAGDSVELDSIRLVASKGTLWVLWRDESGVHVSRVV